MPHNPNSLLEFQSALLTALIILLPVCARLVQQCLELRLSELKVKLDSNTAITKRNEAQLKTTLEELAATRAQIAQQCADTIAAAPPSPRADHTEGLNA